MSAADRELLVLAAKAAGVRGAWDPFRNQFRRFLDQHEMFIGEAWAPDADDGDALRLAVALKMSIDVRDESVCVIAGNCKHVVIEKGVGPELGPATRLAILRVASKIGKAMP